MVKKLVCLFIILLVSLGSFPLVGLTEEIGQGEQLFQTYCVGCHPNGNNIIRRGKTLKSQALKRYKMDSLEAITNLVTYGKNNMSAFQDRLSQPEIESVARYVLEQAEKDWR
ncbi:cytochrome c class I [Gloeothece citriformis PCC 7424]|uniref:Cytochrome c class I n=1 Tax=Gloeothece citriformis (strain PCC 7424) TaxID=65393 RepID=B7KHC6_GLOC7|nr:c-type cytochrome [Gloeothece citriformis]ACK69335.1 cytochrome c class I [Gloeothece citriformis PCC 7424]